MYCVMAASIEPQFSMQRCIRYVYNTISSADSAPKTRVDHWAKVERVCIRQLVRTYNSTSWPALTSCTNRASKSSRRCLLNLVPSILSAARSSLLLFVMCDPSVLHPQPVQRRQARSRAPLPLYAPFSGKISTRLLGYRRQPSSIPNCHCDLSCHQLHGFQHWSSPFGGTSP